MRNILILAALASTLAMPAAAQSVSSPTGYGGIGYTQLDGDGVDVGALSVRIGGRFSPNIGVEAEASVGIVDDDFEVAGVRGSVHQNYEVAGYAIGFLPLSDQFELHARVGYGTTSVGAEGAGATATEDGSSLNYGVGGTFLINPRNGIRVDWTRRDFTDDNDGELDTYGVSYVQKF